MSPAAHTDDVASTHGLTRELVFSSLLLVAVMVVLGVLSYQLHVRFEEMSAWLPTGVAVGAVLVYGYRLAAGAFLGAFLQMFLVSSSPSTAFVYGVAVALACVTIRYLLALFKLLPCRLERVRVLAAVMIVAMAATLLMSLALTPGQALLLQHASHKTAPAAVPEMAPSGHAMPMSEAGTVHGDAHGAGHGGPAEPGLGERLFAEPLGVLFLAPLVIWFAAVRKESMWGLAHDWRGASVVLLLLLGMTLAIYSGYLEEHFGVRHATLLVLPPAVWLALEYGMGYTLLANLLVFFIAGMGTSLGLGPFKDHTSGFALLTLIYCLTTLLIAASRAERMAVEAIVHSMATRDALTGLPNRLLFDEHLGRSLAIARRQMKKVAVMFIDLDHFKRVNDTLGHDVGDALLTEAAARIKACLRGDSILSRFGGDEFTVLVDNLDDPKSLQNVTGRIVESLNQPFEIKGHVCHISCSGGISVFPDDAETASELLKKADIAMYEVKYGGRNSFRFFSPAMHGYLDGDRR